MINLCRARRGKFMEKSVPGHGAVSIILIFTVLCLTIFAVISLNQALSDRVLANAASKIVIGYYEADALAERVLVHIQGPGQQNILGVDVTVEEVSGRNIATFSVPVAENMDLAVEAVLSGTGNEILVWRLRNTDDWIPEVEHPLFFGF